MNLLREQIGLIADNAGGFMGTVSAVDAATGTVSVDIGTGTPVSGIYVLSDFSAPVIGDYMIVLKVGTFYVAWSRKTRSPVRTGKVTALTAGSTLSVDVGGGVVLTLLPYLASYTPAVNDVVFLGAWDATYVVLGKTGTASVAPPPVIPEPEFPTTEYGETTCYSNTEWAGDKNRTTNAWSWTSGLGYVGIEKEFMGTDIHEFQTLHRYDFTGLPAGVSITSIKLVLDISGAILNSDTKVKTLIRPHNYTAPPPGTPSWDARTITQVLDARGFMAGVKQTITLPSAWLTDLLAGTVKGIGFAPHNSADGWGSMTVSSRIVISWKRTV